MSLAFPQTFNVDTRASLFYTSADAVVIAGLFPDICPKLNRYGGQYYCGTIKRVIEDISSESSKESAFLKKDEVRKFCYGNSEPCPRNKQSK